MGTPNCLGQFSFLSQKYYLVVMLVEVTTVGQLVDRLKKGKYIASGTILAKSMLSTLNTLLDLHSPFSQ
jgi:uncharacterized protein YlbG (UPF0298 family)